MKINYETSYLLNGFVLFFFGGGVKNKTQKAEISRKYMKINVVNY